MVRGDGDNSAQYNAGGDVDSDAEGNILGAEGEPVIYDDEPEFDANEFVPSSRIVPVASKAGGSTSMVVTENSNYPIGDVNSLLIFLSSKDVSTEQWIQFTNIGYRWKNLNLYPIFIDLPGYGKAKAYSKPNEVSGARGWNIFAHMFFKVLFKIYGERDCYFVALDEAGEFITPLIVESGIFAKKDATNSAMKKQQGQFERVKFLMMSHDLVGFNALPPIKIDRFHVDHWWFLYALKGTDLKNVPDRLIMKSLRKARFANNARLYKSYEGPVLKAGNAFIRHLGEGDLKSQSSQTENRKTYTHGFFSPNLVPIPLFPDTLLTDVIENEGQNVYDKQLIAINHDNPVLHPKDIRAREAEYKKDLRR